VPFSTSSVSSVRKADPTRPRGRLRRGARPGGANADEPDCQLALPSRAFDIELGSTSSTRRTSMRPASNGQKASFTSTARTRIMSGVWVPGDCPGAGRARRSTASAAARDGPVRRCRTGGHAPLYLRDDDRLETVEADEIGRARRPATSTSRTAPDQGRPYATTLSLAPFMGAPFSTAAAAAR